MAYLGEYGNGSCYIIVRFTFGLCKDITPKRRESDGRLIANWDDVVVYLKGLGLPKIRGPLLGVPIIRIML